MMESAIRLCYSPLHSAPLRLSYGSKGSENARASTFHLRFNHANLCLPHFSISQSVARSFRHANCMLNRYSVPSKNEGSDNKILRGVTGASLVLACVLGLFNFCGKMNPKFDTAYAMYPFSMSNNDPKITLGGGEAAFESIMHMVNPEGAEKPFPGFYYNKDKPDKASVDALKLHAIRLSKSGRKNEALEILEMEYRKCDLPEAQDNLRMAIVELLLFQGDYDKARKWLDDRIDEQMDVENPKQLNYEEKIKKLVDSYKGAKFEFDKLSIAQILLRKAIVHTMLKHNKEAAKWWEAFAKTLT